MSSRQQSSEPIPCPYCRRPLRILSSGSPNADFVCEQCGIFPNYGSRGWRRAGITGLVGVDDQTVPD